MQAKQSFELSFNLKVLDQGSGRRSNLPEFQVVCPPTRFLTSTWNLGRYFLIRSCRKIRTSLVILDNESSSSGSISSGFRKVSVGYRCKKTFGSHSLFDPCHSLKVANGFRLQRGNVNHIPILHSSRQLKQLGPLF